MCYSNSSTSSSEELGKRYNKPVSNTQKIGPIYHASGFQFPKWNVILNESIESMNWGLIPSWFSQNDWQSIASKTLNARIETINEKASFRHLVSNKRCIIPSSGFFEWQTLKTEKIPYFIFPKDNSVFSMAGLYDDWVDKSTGECHRTFSIITNPANELMAEIHNSKKRMPYMLSPSFENDWLSGKINSLNDNYLLPSDGMNAHRINKKLLLSSEANCQKIQEKYVDNIGQQASFF